MQRCNGGKDRGLYVMVQEFFEIAIETRLGEVTKFAQLA